MIPAFEIDAAGDLHTLYTEELDLQAIGPLYDVHRASRIDFDETRQVFAVIDASTGEEVHANRSRSAAIGWEIEHFSPGGALYHART